MSFKRSPNDLVILSTGYGGTGQTPLIYKLASSLKLLSMRVVVVAWPRRRPSSELADEVLHLQRTLHLHRSNHLGRVIYIGRSFGSRVCARLAQIHPPDAMIILGSPIRPPGKRRPADEDALVSLRCPTLIIQGDRDELGPLAVLHSLVKENSRIQLQVLNGTGHSFGAKENMAIQWMVEWLCSASL